MNESTSIELQLICRLSVGFSLFLTWMLGFLFLRAGLANNFTYIDVIHYVLPLAVFAASSAFISFTDQKMLKAYSSRITLVVGVVAMSAGTALSFLIDDFNHPFALEIVVSIFIGAGSSIAFFFWGTAFSRFDARVIAISTSLSCALSLIFITLLLSASPQIRSCFFVICPLASLLFQWQCTPISYAIRRSIPLFGPLPVNRTPFILLVLVAMFLFGASLNLLLSPGLSVLFMGLSLDTMSSCALASAIMVFMSWFVSQKNNHSVWRRYQKWMLLIFVFCTVCDYASLFSANVNVLFSCIEFFAPLSLAWSYGAFTAQNFRISPIMTFGISACGIAIGFYAGFAIRNFLTQAYSLSYLEMLIFSLSFTLAACLTIPAPYDLKKMANQKRRPEETQKSTYDETNELIALAEKQTKHQPRKSLLRKLLVEESTSKDALCQNQAEMLHRDPSDMPDTAPAETELGMPSKELDSEQTDTAPFSSPFKLRCEKIANENTLSNRETEVLFLLAKGYSTTRITEKLFISKNTAKTHIAHIYRKLDVHSKQELQELVDKTPLTERHVEQSDK